MSFLYELRRNDQVINSSDSIEDFFENIYHRMENNELESGDSFTTSVTDGFSEGRYFIIYNLDNYNFGSRSVAFTKTLEEAIDEAETVHYGPSGNQSYIYEVEYDGGNLVTVVKKIKTRVVSKLCVID